MIQSFYRASIAFLLLSASGSYAIDPLPNVSGTMHGYTAGEFSVDELGASTYNIPLTFAPGTRSAAPKLSLVYNSGVGNSSQGMGWSLGGLSSISRCGTTIAQDGFNDAVDFDANDKYCLDGKRLLTVSGTYGQQSSVYHTENETYVRVTAAGSAGNGPLTFTVVDREGMVFEYGTTPNSRIEASARPDILIWNLAEVRDQNGNYYAIQYEKSPVTAEHYVSQINYSGKRDALNGSITHPPYNSINFLYEQRSDPIDRLIMETNVATEKRLVGIQSIVGQNLVREYRLTYSQSNATGRSLMTSLTECDGVGACLAPTTFTYTQQPAGFAPAVPWGNVDLSGLETDSRHYSDLNADGFADLILFDQGPCNSNQICIDVAISNNGVLGPLQRWGVFPLFDPNYGTFGAFDNGRKWEIADLTNDGIPELVSWSGAQYIWVYRGTGTSFLAPVIWHDTTLVPANGPTSGLVDLSGDGQLDFVYAVNGSELFVAHGTGSSFATPVPWLPSSSATGINPYSCGGSRDRYPDLNGDGLPDKAWVPCGRDDLWVAINNGGTGFHQPQMWAGAYSINGKHPFSHSPGTEQFVDLNGDGLSDYVWIEMNGKNLWVLRSTGIGFFPPQIWVADGTIPGGGDPFSGNTVRHEGYGDVNGDGLTDKVWLPQNGPGNLMVALSTGRGFQTPAIWLSGFPAYSLLGSNEEHIDVNGDGLTDKVWRPGTNCGSYQCRPYVALAQQKLPDLLEMATDGIGASIVLEYRPLTDTSIYQKGTGAVHPNHDIIDGRRVVSSYHIANGIGQTTIQLKYTALRSNLHGRGILGFETTTTVDTSQGTATTTYYRQDHPFKTLVWKTETRELSSGTLLRRETRSWAQKPFAYGGYFPYIAEVRLEEFQPNGAPVSTTVRAKDYDDYGNVLSDIVDYGGGNTTAITYSYQNDVQHWILGRPILTVETRTSPTSQPITRTSIATFDSAGLLATEVVEPNVSELRLERTYSRDLFGNVIQVDVSGLNFHPRSSYSEYDSRGQFAVLTRNEMGHIKTQSFDERHGQVRSEKGPNGLTTTWTYDGFGRKIHELRPDGIETRWLYLAANAPTDPQFAAYFVRTDSSQAPPQISYYDSLNRVIEQRTAAFAPNQIIIQSHRYNSKGQLTDRSEPYFAGDSALFTHFDYDILNRLTVETAGNGATTSYFYNGLSRTIVNALGHSSTALSNTRGQIVQMIDAIGSATNYEYDGYGNMTKLIDPLGNETAITYDLRGRKIAILDLDLGVRSYGYDSLSNIISETNARGETVTSSYDVLGRMTSRVEPEGITTWTYDSSRYGIGKLASVVSFDGYREVYEYSPHGRLASTTTFIDGLTFTQNQTYDDYGRVKDITYPTGYTVSYDYTNFGYLDKVVDGISPRPLFQTLERSARGKIQSFELGDGNVSTRYYDPVTGLIQTIQTGIPGTPTIQNNEYLFDPIGSLIRRRDLIQGLEEQFTYDALSRLTSTQVVGGYGVTIGYDVIGNIASKSDTGTYSYLENGAGPHAVSSISDLSGNLRKYEYDRNGNQLFGGGRSIQYSSFDKPTRIILERDEHAFSYGPQHTLEAGQSYRRYKQRRLLSKKVSNSPIINYYVNDLYEEQILSNGTVLQQHYIKVADETIAIRTGPTGAIRYLHRDHLGSIEAITDQAGVVLERQSYDAWGKRRNSNWSISSTFVLSGLARGFTGHEHLDSVGLIHMNGRIYDPAIGRFLSADPFVQAIENLQALNRYSYVLNNPLSATDPSGYFFKNLFKSAGKLLKKHGATILTIAAIVATQGALSGIANQVVAKIAANTAGAFVGNLARGGELSEAASFALKASATTFLSLGVDGLFTIPIESGIKTSLPNLLGTSGAANPNNLSLSSRLSMRAARELADASVGAAKTAVSGGNFATEFVRSIAGGGLLIARDGFIESQAGMSVFGNLADYGVTWAAGEGESLKGPGIAVVNPRANNVGLALTSLNASGFFSEGGEFSRFANQIPGLNSAAVFHDVVATSLEITASPALSYALNVATIAPALAVNYGALIANSSLAAMCTRNF